jgi:hypothetical protein
MMYQAPKEAAGEGVAGRIEQTDTSTHVSGPLRLGFHVGLIVPPKCAEYQAAG